MNIIKINRTTYCFLMPYIVSVDVINKEIKAWQCDFLIQSPAQAAVGGKDEKEIECPLLAHHDTFFPCKS